LDETRRAKELLAQGRNEEAERIARVAVETLDRGGEQALLAEALITHGTALARTPLIEAHTQEARTALERAGTVAEHLGDAATAGEAALTLIEELHRHLAADELLRLYQRADELFEGSPPPDISRRLRACARLVIDRLAARGSIGGEEAGAEFSTPAEWEGLTFREKMQRYERILIQQALRDAGGVVTRAAQLLGFKHHYSLIDLLNKRHKDLRNARSPIVPRKRSIMGRARTRFQRTTGQQKPMLSILHVEDSQLVAAAVRSTLEAEGWRVESCADGLTALRKLSGEVGYDLLLLDNELPGLSGFDLAQIARKLPHRRRMPIIMLSAGDCETEAWRAGVDAFLRKPNDVLSITETITRLTNPKSK
jgi:CheY-like chemotaxis protein